MEIAGTQGAQSVTDILQALQAALADHYVLERELGRGGMATVFLAKDLRHARPVAIKVLHPELAAVLGAQRFLAEIRTTAALQHPHILPLFDSGSIGGLLYYVMPYVEGETLRGRLARERQLPLVDSVRIATAVATALEYAHRHGVIHRDIKPENILLGEDGHALVADFGIALAVSEAAGERLTQSGLSLGTPQYMAPEQAAGERALDARADVYALGAVLYEMLAGEPPFTGPTPQGVIARVMTEEPPPLTRHRRSVPPHVDAVVRTALEKVPADRYPTAAAFAAALSPAATIQGLDTRVARPAPRSRRVTVTLAAGTFIAAAAIGWTLGRTSSHASTERSPVRFTIELDSGATGFGESAGFGELAISPDGRTVVFSAEVAEGTRLYMRRLDEISVRPLAGTEDADAPFFSPDGAWVAFYSNGAIRKMRLDGGAPVPVVQLPSPAKFGGGAWGRDDTIYFALQPAGTLWRVSAAGGPATRVAVADTVLRLVNPHPLPGGRALLVTVVQSASFNAAHVGVLDLASGHLRRFNPGEGARYVAGSIVYGTVSGELYGQPYDVGRLEPSGSPEQIASGLPNGYSFDVSDAGALAYRVGRRRSDYVHGRLTLTDSAGRVQRIIQARVPWLPRFSPDGRRLVFGAYAPGRDSSDVWVVNDLETGTTERLTTDGNDNNNPVWSPDGQRIAFSTLAPGGKDVVVKAIDGGPASPLVRRAGNQWPTDWVRDGSAVLFSEQVRAGGQDIWVQRLQAGEPFGAAHPYVASQAAETGARVSPDGRWVAYQSDETGRVEVYVQSYPTPGRKTLVSTAGGTNPIWHRDGRTLYYWKGDQLVAARLEVDGAGSPIAVRSRALRFRAPYVQHDAAMYDVSPDGARFAIIMSDSRPGRLVVALDVLGRRAESRGGRERTNAP